MTNILDQNANRERLTASRVALDAAVGELYFAFQHRTLLPGGPDVCTACCMPLESKKRFAATPKPEISFEDLSEFHSAAKGGEETSGQDLVYVLPRTMEFLSQGRVPNFVGLFALFAHYFAAVWPTLSEREQEAVRRFSGLLSQWRLTLNLEDPCEFDFSDIIEMCASGGFDMKPVFDVIANPPRTLTAAQNLSGLLLYETGLWMEDGSEFFEIPAEQAAMYAKNLRTALSSPKVISLLESAALLDDQEELAERASLGHQLAEGLVGEKDS